MSRSAEISYLINKFLFYKLNEEEERVLFEWRKASTSNEQLFQRLTDKSKLGDKVEKFRQLYPNSLWDKTRARLNLETGYDTLKEPEMLILSPKTIKWLITGVIIVALIGISAGLYIIWKHS